MLGMAAETSCLIMHYPFGLIVTFAQFAASVHLGFGVSLSIAWQCLILGACLSAVDVIELSSDSEDESNEDDCVMVPSTEEEEEEEDIESEDLNDGGAHINDEFNRLDDQGRVLVNVDHPSEDPDIFLSPQVAKAIKPHQVCAQLL